MELRIRVGAAIDRSMSEAFRPLTRAAEQAKTVIERSARQAGQAQTRETQRAVKDQDREYARAAREVERWQREKARAAERAAAAQARLTDRTARDEVRTAERAARDKQRAEARQIAAARQEARQRARDEIAAAREVEREIARSNRDRKREETRAARQAERDSRNSFAHKFFDPHRNAQAAYGLVGSAARRAAGIVGDIAHGAGVRTNLGSFIGGEIDLEKKAVDVTNAGYMPGHAGANGKRVDPNALIAQMRDVGNATGFDPGKALDGLQKFVAKTGDLESGRDVILDMARYARASGAELDDMVDAAGDVSNALGDVPNKGEAIKNVMRAIAAQGKEGAVEIKDLATQMAKLSAASSQFSGDPQAVMAQMGAMVQMTRAKGGAASATQAATSLGSFTNTFSKGARLNAFKHFGVDIRGEDGRLDLRKIILGSLAAASSDKHGGTKNFSQNMGQMFMDVAARRSMKGWETTYLEAGGGQAGLDAVAKKFDELASATMNEKEVTESFNRSMQTTEAQVTLFNNEMSKTANELKTVLLPAFQGLAPVILGITKTAADWIGQITGTKKANADSEQVNAEIRAINARSGIGGLLKKGSGTDDEVDAASVEAMNAKRALESEIAKKSVEVAEERKNFDLGFGHSMTDDEIRKEAQSVGDGGDDARKFLRDQEALTRMKDTLDQLNRQQNELADRIAQRTLRVVLVGDTRPPEMQPNPPTRTPAPGAKPR